MSADSNTSDTILNICCANGTKFTVEAPLDLSIAEFKVLVTEKSEVPADCQRLIYKGTVLKDEQTLESYGVESDHNIHLLRCLAASTASSLPMPTVYTRISWDRRIAWAHRAWRAPNNMEIGDPPPLRQVVESAYSRAAARRSALTQRAILSVNRPARNSISDLSGVEIQHLIHYNPIVMSEITNLPVIQNIMNNSQMRQIIDQNPEVGHALNDPAILLQTLEAARNPERMREMMRNTDRTMSNTESSSEGDTIYETVQQPFLNVATIGEDTGGDLRSNPSGALLGNQGAVQPGDNTRNSAASTVPTAPTAGSNAPNTNPLPNPWNTTSGGTQTADTRSNPASNAQAAGITGMRRRRIRDLERVMSSRSVSPPLTQIAQAPAEMQLMQNLLSDSQSRNQILSFSNLLESNPQFREMLQNPEFLRQGTSPETMQQLLSLQQSIFSPVDQQQPREQNQTGSGLGAFERLDLNA